MLRSTAFTKFSALQPFGFTLPGLAGAAAAPGRGGDRTPLGRLAVLTLGGVLSWVLTARP